MRFPTGPEHSNASVVQKSEWQHWLPPLLTALIIAANLLAISDANAVPSFGIQTSQPCAACHIGSFGGRLKTTGRDFKLYGYALDDNRDHFIPLNVNTRFSFTHTDADQTGGASDGFSDNDNFAFDGMTISYAGKIAKNLGATARLGYNGIRGTWAWGGVDVRYAEDDKWWDTDVVWGISLNNGPTRSDIFESVPNAGAPTTSSGLSRRPRQNPISASLSGIVAGASFYTMVDETVYTEVSVYNGLNRDTLNALGVDPLNGSDSFAGPIPYARLAVQHEFDNGKHFAAFGVSGLYAETYPKDIHSAGTNKFTDGAADAMYQWIENPASAVSDMISARVGYAYERAELDASARLSGTNPVNKLGTLRADIAYSIDATYTMTAQFFETVGTQDRKRWGGSGKIDARGWVAQLDYVPWGKPDSPADWINARLSFQYTAYEEFAGRGDNASDRNTFLISLSIFGTANQ